MIGRMRPTTRLLFLLLAVLVAGCSSTPPASTSPAPTPPALGSAPGSGASTASPSAAAASPAGASAPPATAEPSSAAATPAGTAEPTDAPEPLPPIGSTAWEQELGNLAPDGTRSLESALRLFAIAFGPLPGVVAPSDGRLVEDGTTAIRAVMTHEKELTAVQRAAIAKAIAPRSDAFRITVDPGQAWVAPTVAFAGGGAPLGFEPPPDVQERLVKEAHNIRTFFAGKLGDIPGRIEIYLSGDTTSTTPGLVLLGFADPAWDASGKYSGCTLVVTGNATNRGDAAAMRTMAHEIFHCFEAATVPEPQWGPMPDWVLEGGAEWAADAIHPFPPKNAGWWRHYLNEPLTPLFKRSYDALGFYGHMAETGIDVWAIYKGMWTSGLDSAAIFRATGADNDAFMDTWASGLLRQPARGRAWNTDEVSISADQVIAPPADIADGGSFNIGVDAYTNWDETLNVSAKYLRVVVTGHARLSDGRVDLVLPGSTLFCTDSGGCDTSCPDGTPLPDATTLLGPSSVIAITGGTAGSSVSAVGTNLDEICKKQKAVWVHIDRGASKGVLAGRVLELVSCTGPFGSWSGVMRLGGIDGGGGFVVPFAPLPIVFTIKGGSATTVVAGTVPTPVFDVNVTYNLAVSVDGSGKRMSITGTGSGENGMFAFSDALGPGLSNLPIEPAPAGRCP